MKKHKYWLALSVVVLVFSVGIVSWLLYKNDLAMQAYVADINERLVMQQGWLAQAEAAETPEQKEKEKKHWKFMVDVAESQIKKIQFVGRIVDQNGDPVPGADIIMGGGGNFLASGSGGFHVKTDNDGYFFVDNAKGSSLQLGGAKKVGYDINVKTEEGYPHFYSFEESDGALLWTDYTREHPYLIKAYKVGKYAKVKSETSRYLSFSPNGSVYTIDFNGFDRVKWEGIRDGDIRVSVTRDEKKWQVKLDGVGGGIQDANDEYMNMAPEAGYQKSLIYSGSAGVNPTISRGIEINKKLYFMSHYGKRYGSLVLNIIPYFSKDESGIYASYVINLEGGRELAVRPKD